MKKPATPLIERMEKKKAPKAWIREVIQLLKEIQESAARCEEYLSIIDNLARERRDIENSEGDR